MKERISPDRAVLLAMIFFLICAVVWAFRVPVVNGVPISFNSDEPSHFLVVKYISENGALPPYTRDFYESAHPPLSDVIEAGFMHLWPTAAQVFALRLLSTLVGLGTIFLIYRTAQLVVPPWTAALAASLVACLPMFIMFSASVTNDPLSVLISSATLFLIVKGLRDGMTKKELNVLCLLIGLAGIAKYTCLGLLPLGMAVVIYDRRRAGQPWAVPVLSIVASFVLISGWWYLRNQILYGDPFRSGAEAAMAMFTGSANPESPSYWVRVATTMMGSFLGLYPSFPKWPLSVYDTVTTLFGLVLGAGLLVGLKRGTTPIKIALVAYALSVLGVVLKYQTDHFQPHGRLLSPAILVVVLGVVGLRHTIQPEKRKLVGIVTVLAMACLSLALVTSSI